MNTAPFSRQRGLLPQSASLRILILALFGLMAAASTYIAVKQALSNGMDYQWSGAHLLAQHQDPWKTYIDGDPNKQIILGQQPNYLAEFYLLLEPLGRMPFEQSRAWWCVLNLIFLAGVLYLVGRIFHLDRDHILLLTFLTLSSTPFRVTMANGQHGIFILLMLSLVAYSNNLLVRGLALGLSYSKYSFSPIIVMVLLLKKRLSLLLVSLFLPLAGLLIAWRMLGGNLKTLLFEPLVTSKLAMWPGEGDVMTALDTIMRQRGFGRDITYTAPALLGLFCAVIAAIWIARTPRLDERMQLAVALILTLACFRHLQYDYVVLVVPVAAALVASKSTARTLVLACMAVFWFITSPINRLFPDANYAYTPKIMAYALLLLVMAIATARLDIDPEPFVSA